MDQTMRLILDTQDRMTRELKTVKREIDGVDNEISKVKNNFRDTAKESNKLADTLKRVFNIAMILAAARAIGQFAMKLISLGSDAEEIQSKFNTVYKHLAADANKWTTQFAKDVGRSANIMRMYMSTFQDTFVPLGFAREQGYEFSKVLVKLGVDLASFNNLAEADVMRDLQSGIVGNTEVFRKYGVIINQTTLNKELMTMGIKEGTKAATEAQKAQARLNLVIQGTSDAQGDAIRTGGGFANLMRRLESTLERIGTGIGSAILPIASNVAKSLEGFLNPVAIWIEDNQNKITAFFVNLPAIAGIAFSYLPGIMKDIFTGGQFVQIVDGMVKILTTGFTAAINVFAELFFAFVMSIPDFFVLMMTNLTTMLLAAVERGMMSEEFKGEVPMERGEWEKEMRPSFTPSVTREDFDEYLRQYDAWSLKNKLLYDKYITDWNTINADFIKARKELQDAQNIALNNIEKNMTPAFEKVGIEFNKAAKQIQKDLAGLGEVGKEIMQDSKMQEALEKIRKLIETTEKELQANTEATNGATTEIEDLTEEIKKIILPSETREAGRYAGMGGYRGSEGGADIPLKDWGMPPPGILEQMGGFEMLLAETTSRLSGFAQTLVQAVATMGPVGILFALLQPVLDGIFSILSPAINETLQPLIDTLFIVGEVLGMVLLPVLNILAPIFQGLGDLIIFLMNKAIIPIINVIISGINIISIVIGTIWNIIAEVANFLFGWLGVRLEKLDIPDIDTGHIEEITPGRSISPGRGGNTYIIQVDAGLIVDEEAQNRAGQRIRDIIQRLEETGA